MSAMHKLATGILTASLLLGSSAAASAVEPVPTSSDSVVTEVAPVLITEADVAAAEAAFKQAQADARTAERQAHRTAKAAEKAAQVELKQVKGKAKKAAQVELKSVRKANLAALKALKSENRTVVNVAKAAYQQIAAAYEAQQAAIIEEPVVTEPVTEEPAVTEPIAEEPATI